MSERETILIVDDQSENISILIEALQDSYDLLAATDGATALERAASATPDIILLDVVMPDMSGHEVCRMLKANPVTADIPVIFVTAQDRPDQEAQGLDFGAVDYITKPISPPVVEARIRAHMQLTQAKRVLTEQNEVLERRVREKTEDVVRMQKERVDGLNNFANALAHQIRNPVMSIGGMAGLMLRKAPEGSPLADYAEAVREEGMRLENLVSVISQYVALAAEELRLVPARSVVEQAVVLATEHALPLGRDFKYAISMTEGEILVDYGLAVQALLEIFKNAIDFAEGEEVNVTIAGGTNICDDEMSVTERFYSADCRYGVRIIDDGPGIPEGNMPHLADPFFTTKARGVGLGLTKAKRIFCDEFGGTLTVSRPGAVGTGVTVTFGSGV